MLDLNIDPELHLHFQKNKGNTGAHPVEKIVGQGNGWVKEVEGSVHVKPVAGRTTLDLQGAGAMKINGSLVIG